MASPEPEPWGGKIIRYKKLASVESEEIGNESSSSEEDLRTRITNLGQNGTGTDRERGYDETGTDGKRDRSAVNAGSAERLALDAASVAVDTWERGNVPKSPDQWSSARSSLVWEEEEEEATDESSETEKPAVTMNERLPADVRLPAPPVHRKAYNRPLEPLEGSSSSCSSLVPPYRAPVRVEQNCRRPAEPVRIELPEERVNTRRPEGLTNGEPPRERADPMWPDGPSDHRERVSIEMPDEVVISSGPSDRVVAAIPDEVFITEQPKDRVGTRPGERDGTGHGVPWTRVSSGGPKERVVEEPLRGLVSMARSASHSSTGRPRVREAHSSTGSPRVREAHSSAGSPRVRVTSTPIGSGDTEPITDCREGGNNAPPKVTFSTEAPSSGSSQALSPLRWDTHLPSAARAGDPLGYCIYARSIAEIVTDKNTEMPLTVGIYGGWGMGKTYLLGKMKETVDKIIEEKRAEHAEYVKGEVDGVEQNKTRGQKTRRFPPVLFYVLLALGLTCLGATVACAFLFDRVWVVFLVGTVVAFILLVATVVHGFRRRILGCCTERVALLQKSNPMHWMVGIYLEWVKPPNMAEKPQDNSLQYEVIWVHFNAWEFSGCKVLWAGIVTTLCDAIEEKVGSRPARFFRVIQGQLNGGGKKALFRRAWFKLLLSAVGVVILVVIVLILVFSPRCSVVYVLFTCCSRVVHVLFTRCSRVLGPAEWRREKGPVQARLVQTAAVGGGCRHPGGDRPDPRVLRGRGGTGQVHAGSTDQSYNRLHHRFPGSRDRRAS
ncbi:uncharacterized protein [Branchiostoma lanceolatum]|uniref:uncharacterized protein isoform X1 n=1 Tax=Branchiostoma lanceolatum TaxID=7740 RepID=UPI003454E100